MANTINEFRESKIKELLLDRVNDGNLDKMAFDAAMGLAREYDNDVTDLEWIADNAAQFYDGFRAGYAIAKNE